MAVQAPKGMAFLGQPSATNHTKQGFSIRLKTVGFYSSPSFFKRGIF